MLRRGSGILLHITSLPSPFGIGDLGTGAYGFADFLRETKQSFWQILPLTPTTPGSSYSPYSSPSAFAGNPLLISPQLVFEGGLLSKSDLRAPSFRVDRADYQRVAGFKQGTLERAYQNFRKKGEKGLRFEIFCEENAEWLEDYALFVSLKDHLGGMAWGRWPKEIRDRRARDLGRLRERLRSRIEMEKFIQYLFSEQWFSLKRDCNERGIQIIGDLPIYVDYESADVWANPEIFKLDDRKQPMVVAGIPPDYYSATGQLWRNPIYRWGVLKEEGYSWWVRRIAHNLMLFDWVRLDHFKGFIDFWEVPAKERTAVKGRWVKGPGEDFFHILLRHFPSLPLIAEDLGVITPEVHVLRDRFGLPGMRVLQFAFGSDPLAEEYKPHNYIRNCVAYTGTHDNDTLISWLYGGKGHSTRRAEEIRIEKRNALNYLGKRGGENIHWEFIRLLMISVANGVIIPMQDLLGLGEEGRMNRPATSTGNWGWRVLARQFTPSLKRRLLEMTTIYGRT